MQKKQIYKHQKPKTIEDIFYITGIFVPVVMIVLLQVKLPPCLFHLLTGYYCPGCGGTRAVRALLHGQILKAAFYHPFVPYAAAVYLYFMAAWTAERISRGRLQIGMHLNTGILWAGAAIIVGNFILKNMLHYYFYGFAM